MRGGLRRLCRRAGGLGPRTCTSIGHVVAMRCVIPFASMVERIIMWRAAVKEEYPQATRRNNVGGARRQALIVCYLLGIFSDATGWDGRRTTDDGRRTTDDGRRTTDDGRTCFRAIASPFANLQKGNFYFYLHPPDCMASVHQPQRTPVRGDTPRTCAATVLTYTQGIPLLLHR